MKVWVKKVMVLWSLVMVVGLSLGGPLEASAKKAKGEAVDLNVMTFNLRYLNDHDASPHSWEERRNTVRQVIRSNQPDIIGTQEIVYQQVKDMEQDLPNYDWIGMGREGGSKGEFMAIFYNQNQFTPLEYDHFWLSDTPDVIGSTSWGNTIPRMATWVKFQDNHSGKEFYFVNTHFDHRSVEAREKSAELISEKVKEFDPNLPVILTGDFNTRPGSKPYNTLINEGNFVDTWVAAETRINEGIGTFNGFDDPTGGGKDNRIDWVLSKGNVTTTKSEIIDYQKNGQFPSDHYPVMAEVVLH
ncbi:endonuclease/exonuclease/phosphatase family protein [Oceanobacillus senegalensis]|uniref:endonuclease/exonuclease/phosphatase family protein n=1 Tax=Oceanobacillus senegalensis TaxID=1936063 RepID=UPI000A30B549|nr:endonuclease/exonuclease/phosphatase family protein [Oceanobacillus senegalensis]